MRENIDYELIPTDNESWAVRMLSGDYIETEFQFGTLTLLDDEETMSFNVDIIKAPLDSITTEDLDFQRETGKVLNSLLLNALDDKDEHNTGTVGIEESPYE